MAIMIVVLVGITESFASGARSETNVARRQQAQADARAALTRMRDDIHCSTGLNSVTQNVDGSGNPTGGFTLELAETNACSAVNTTGGGSKVALRWCTIPSAIHLNAFSLYRTTGACDGTTGVRMAKDVVIPTAGAWLPNTLATGVTNWAGNIWPTPPSCTAAGYLPTVKVDLAVNPNVSGSSSETYELQDQIAIRNAVRCAGGSAGGGGSANPTLDISAPSGGTSGVPIAGSQIKGIVAASNNESSPITFMYFTGAPPPTDCTTGGSSLGTAATTGNGSYPSSGSIASPAATTYWWYATIASDGTNAAATSPCGDSSMPHTVVLATKWSPTLSLTSPDSASVGSAISPTSLIATMALSSGQTTGTLTFKWWRQSSAPTGSACTSTGTTLGTASPTGDGLWSPSAGIASASAGTYWWYASFAGDATDNAVATTCGGTMASTVVKVQPTLSVTAPGVGVAGVAITTASVTGTLASGSTPTGTLAFTVFGPQASPPSDCTTGGTPLGTNVTVAGNAAYHPNATFTPAVGTYWWYASYSGDASNNPATSACDSTMASTVVAVATPPTVVSVQLKNASGGTAGRVDTKGDQIIIKFSKQMNVSTLCSSWSGNAVDQSVSGVDVTVQDGPGATSDSITVSSGACTFNFGSIILGAATYVGSGNLIFTGNGGNAGTATWTAATNTLTITLASKTTGSGVAATVALSTATYTPSGAITDSSGTPVAGTGSTGNVQNF